MMMMMEDGRWTDTLVYLFGRYISETVMMLIGHLRGFGVSNNGRNGELGIP
jgi:hypothetical protein